MLFPVKHSHIWMSPLGRQLTIFNTQATVAIGGSDRSRPFQGQLSGFHYNGLKVLNMASEGNANIKINGSVRLVGDVPSGPGSARSTAMSPEMSTTFIETTTMMSTTTTRKHRSSSTVQVRIHYYNNYYMSGLKDMIDIFHMMIDGQFKSSLYTPAALTDKHVAIVRFCKPQHLTFSSFQPCS